MPIGVTINGAMFMLWCVMAAFVGFGPMLPALLISGVATLIFAITAN